MVNVLPAPRSLALAIIPLGIAVAIGNAVLLLLFQVQHRLPDIVQASATAFVIAEGSLVAIWIAFGNRPLPVRMVFAVPGVCVTFLPHSTGPYGVDAFAIGMILVVGASLPSLTFRIIGWRLMRLTIGPGTANLPAVHNPVQFSLRQMFGWTLAVAMVAGMVRILLRPEDLNSRMIVDLLANGAICLFFGAIASATAWAAFNPRRPLAEGLLAEAVAFSTWLCLQDVSNVAAPVLHRLTAAQLWAARFASPLYPRPRAAGARVAVWKSALQLIILAKLINPNA